jgi:hypothetical protein
MKKCLVLTAAAALFTSGFGVGADWVRTPDGEIYVPPVTAPAPMVDVDVTGSIGPRLRSTDLGPTEREPVARRGCSVDVYEFGRRDRVRVHRC